MRRLALLALLFASTVQAVDLEDFYRFNSTDADKKWLAYSRTAGFGQAYIPRFAIDAANSSATTNYLTVRLTDGTAYYVAGGGGGGGGGATYPDTAHWTLTGTAADVNVTNFPASQAVTGTFWQATQPVSGTFWQATQPVSGSVSVSNFPATQPVSGTFWQSTQPVSIASMPSTPVTGTFWQTTQPVSGTFWQTTQPVSGPLTDTQLRASAVPVSGTFWQATQPVSGTVAVSNFPASQAVTGTFFQATQPVSGTVAATQSGTWSVNEAQIGGTNTVSGGLAGSLAIGGTQANNAAITANPVIIGVEARSSTPTAATNGNVIRSAGDLAGNQFNVMPIAWSCNLQSIGATLTQCQAVPASGYSLYVTGWIALSSTSTAATYRLAYGTGSNCGTGTTGLFPGPGLGASARTMVLPANTAAPHVVTLGEVGIKVPAANAVCAIGVATNTLDLVISGYTAP